MKIFKDCPLSGLTSFGVGGRAKEVWFPESLEDFLEALNCERYYILGNGTNVLASDKGYDGRIICTKRLNKISAKEHTYRTNSTYTFCRNLTIKVKNCRTDSTEKFLSHKVENAEGSSAKYIRGRKEEKDIRTNRTKKLVLCTNCTKKTNMCTDSTEEVWLECEAGTSLFSLNKLCAERSLGGLEFSYGIPGSVGGATVMNAGAFSGQMSDVVKYVLIIENGELKRLEELGFSYRHSVLEGKAVYAVGLRLFHSKGVKERQEDFKKKRLSSQPQGVRSAGSYFKRKGEVIPAQIIDKLGLKGVKINGAEVSKVHAGFIINSGGATCEDLLKLAELVKARVKEAYGVELEEEIRFLE